MTQIILLFFSRHYPAGNWRMFLLALFRMGKLSEDRN
jgi:hypothetical protein